MGKEKKAHKGEKRKRSDESQIESPTVGLKLVGKSKDAELDDIFNKSVCSYLKGGFQLTHQATLNQTSTVSAIAGPSTFLEVSSNSELVKDTQGSGKKPKKSVRVQEVEEDDEPVIGPVEGGPSGTPISEKDDSQVDISDQEDLIHETLRSGPSKKKVKGKKYVPSDETPGDRDRRTIFVGNVPLECAKVKSALTKLRAHILSYAPSAKIESVRFRSVPFATPTSILPSDNPEKDETRRLKREKERAATWREQIDHDPKSKSKTKSRDDEEVVDTSKVYIDAKGKRKVAFIKKDFHDQAATCNAYIVFEHPPPDRSKNLPPLMNPYEAANLALKADGSEVMGRSIRVDVVRASGRKGDDADGTSKKRDGWLPSGTDPKRSLFVGGLDYAAKEEDVRVFFEELVKKERGDSPDGRWVTGVRIVRDKETQLGKGFGYVHFTDRESVDEIIALNSTKLKLAKRDIRVQQCKTLPSATVKPSPITNLKSSDKTKPKTTSARSIITTIPKGNPALGEKLKDLSKEERKMAKSTDADRQARRLAKKKLRHGMARNEEKGSVKLNPTSAERASKRAKVISKKGRVRSEKAVARMKGQRD
ncbi:hypothetical protein TREMEDRAFT_70147 [Tremella mesenterica DSM 1558]|uniref:uncharacterized protein n=1 Tax=Tremella mesenterica (strain ATCC 24925 / CBS 8224 / DSM 1558 / NBRC 9311 / NRRL Y-6157 / RJB 2259-6 / UBC 559-6) TaxID=578456 RepID=UPI00032D584C|nr:uncharacterized protein TREMEDRAFT_70147 [Tremella mesenterica DSM 1558]EIW66582.1 hypothetical protein TREMEDRAFT_70147 [Tremella mesenterica DSM 1558]